MSKHPLYTTISGPKVPFSTQQKQVLKLQRNLRSYAMKLGKSTAQKNSDLASTKIPTYIHDIDNGRTVGYGVDLAEDHPGFLDTDYKLRRKMIADLAKQHQIREKAIWKDVYLRLKELHPLYACKEYNEAFIKLGFSENHVPQLEEVSQKLMTQTGWQIRPVAGLMSPRDFLNGFAFKTFHAAQYFRHHSKPMYTPEPDLVHEILGHVALLTNPAYSSLIHNIGLASLGASPKLMSHLRKVYYYTIEFGVVNEGNDIKAFGAGIFLALVNFNGWLTARLKFNPSILNSHNQK